MNEPDDAPSGPTPELRFPDGWECEAKCENCGRVRPHTIVRLTLPEKPKWCDECHSEVKR